MAKTTFTVQRYYGRAIGWQAEEFCRSYEEAREMMACFKEEEPNARFRISTRRAEEPEFIGYTAEDERVLALCEELGF